MALRCHSDREAGPFFCIARSRLICSESSAAGGDGPFSRRGLQVGFGCGCTAAQNHHRRGRRSFATSPALKRQLTCITAACAREWDSQQLSGMTKMTIVVIFGFGWCPERFTYGQKFGLQKMVSEPSPPSSHREWSFLRQRPDFFEWLHLGAEAADRSMLLNLLRALRCQMGNTSNTLS